MDSTASYEPWYSGGDTAEGEWLVSRPGLFIPRWTQSVFSGYGATVYTVIVEQEVVDSGDNKQKHSNTLEQERQEITMGSEPIFYWILQNVNQCFNHWRQTATYFLL